MQEETRWTLPAGASALTPASDSEDGAKRDSSGYIIDSDSGSDSETDAKADDEAEELARQRWKVSRFQETAGLSSFELAETILLAAGGDVKAALAQCRADGLGIVGRIGALTVGRDPPRPRPAPGAAEPTRSAPVAAPAAAPLAYDCFLSHDWGTDESGRSNHSRVSRVCAALRSAGLRPWFDEEEMRGDINQRMVEGVEGSGCVVCFVTRNYLRKAWGKGPAGDDDNCKFEFDYACRRKGVARMVTAVMEAGCRNPSAWEGTVGGKLGGKLYIDLSSDDDDAFAAAVERLVGEVRTVCGGGSPAAGAT